MDSSRQRLTRQNAIRRPSRSPVLLEMQPAATAAEVQQVPTPNETATRKLNYNRLVQGMCITIFFQILYIIAIDLFVGFVVTDFAISSLQYSWTPLATYFVSENLIIAYPQLREGPWVLSSLWLCTHNATFILMFKEFALYDSTIFLVLVATGVTTLIIAVLCYWEQFNFRLKGWKLAAVIQGMISCGILCFLIFELSIEIFYGIAYSAIAHVYLVVDIELIIRQGRFEHTFTEDDYFLATLAFNLDVIRLLNYAVSLFVKI